MSTKDQPPAARTPGAHRAQAGQHHFNFGDLNRIKAAPNYSPVVGGCVEGDRLIVAVMTAPAGQMADAHSHPNEQWIYVLDGIIDMNIDGKDYACQAGEVLYIPANIVHSGGARAGQDARFFTAKDGSHGLAGTRVGA
jgi:quercetin dioxygenase-like cupin family protein